MQNIWRKFPSPCAFHLNLTGGYCALARAVHSDITVAAASMEEKGGRGGGGCGDLVHLCFGGTALMVVDAQEGVLVFEMAGEDTLVPYDQSKRERFLFDCGIVSESIVSISGSTRLPIALVDESGSLYVLWTIDGSFVRAKDIPPVRGNPVVMSDSAGGSVFCVDLHGVLWELKQGKEYAHAHSKITSPVCRVLQARCRCYLETACGLLYQTHQWYQSSTGLSRSDFVSPIPLDDIIDWSKMTIACGAGKLWFTPGMFKAGLSVLVLRPQVTSALDQVTKVPEVPVWSRMSPLGRSQAVVLGDGAVYLLSLLPSEDPDSACLTQCGPAQFSAVASIPNLVVEFRVFLPMQDETVVGVKIEGMIAVFVLQDGRVFVFDMRSGKRKHFVGHENVRVRAPPQAKSARSAEYPQ